MYVVWFGFGLLLKCVKHMFTQWSKNHWHTLIDEDWWFEVYKFLYFMELGDQSGSIAHYGCPFNLKILFFSVWFPWPQLNCWFLVFNSMVDSSSTEFWIRHLCTPWYFTHLILLFHVRYCRLVNIVLSIGHLACSVQTIFVFLLRLPIWEELKTCPLE